MIDDQSRREFEVRLYRWAKSEAIVEVEAGFPHLRSFTAGFGPRVVKMHGHLLDVERIPFALALVKRWRTEIVELLGEPMTERETEYVHWYQKKALISTPAERIVSGEYRLGDRPAVRRKILAAAIEAELRPIFGEDGGEDRGVYLHYAISHRRWTITTVVGFGGRRNPLQYDHRIELVDQDRIPRDTLGHVTLFSYLGIAGQTAWYCLSAAEEEGASRCIADLTRRFLIAGPSLLDGL
jgi:hypothetical protein